MSAETVAFLPAQAPGLLPSSELPAPTHSDGNVDPLAGAHPASRPPAGPWSTPGDGQSLGAQPHKLTAVAILNKIASYSTWAGDSGGAAGAVQAFLPAVSRAVASGAPVRMLLPGFPFKDGSGTTTLGVLPDLGEELALAHLQGLCDSVSSVYAGGAEVLICSDGLVYNDLLGVSQAQVWEYGEGVRGIAASKQHRGLGFVRLRDVLEFDLDAVHWATDPKASYIEHAASIRDTLLERFGHEPTDADDNHPKPDVNASRRLDTFSQVLGEAQHSDQARTASRMQERARAYGRALSAAYPDHVRLSIHDSDNSDRFSVSLLPSPGDRRTVGMMPWRCAVAVGVDGSYGAVLPHGLHGDYEVIHHHQTRRPYFLRARSPMFDWAASGLDVHFEHLYPCGVIIRPSGSSAPISLRQVPMDKVRHLSNSLSPVVLRGFEETTDEDLWVEKGHELGEILSWALTGTIFKVLDTGDTDKMANNVTSNEPLPMHFDGIFKFKEETDPDTGAVKKTLNPPGYQYFTCLHTAPPGDGFTLFSNSRLFFEHLPPPWTLEMLEPITWEMANDGFWTNKHTGLPLVVRHPATGRPCVRWHSPWDGEKTKYSTYRITIENGDQAIVPLVEALTYDYRVCLRFSWEVGDVLVSDNVAMLHTRTGYASACKREMWRIHLD